MKFLLSHWFLYTLDLKPEPWLHSIHLHNVKNRKLDCNIFQVCNFIYWGPFLLRDLHLINKRCFYSTYLQVFFLMVPRFYNYQHVQTSAASTINVSTTRLRKDFYKLSIWNFQKVRLKIMIFFL